MNADPSWSIETVEFLRHGRVAPLTALEFARNGRPGKFDGGVYDSDGTICRSGVQIKSAYRNEPAPLPPDVSPEIVPGRHLFGGMLQNEHFGHFMAESLSRLWAIRHLDQSFASLVFYLRVPSRPIAGFALEMLRLLEPNLELTVVSRPTEFDVLAVPRQIVHPGYGYIYGHPAARELFSGIRSITASGARKVYVSRSRLTREGGVLMESAIDRNLEAEGYRVIHPQELSIREQLAIYNSADSLIFSEGSALHLYAFVARPDQRLYIIWRRELNPMFGWQIATFGGPAIQGSPCIRTLWIPESDTDPVHARAALDFVELRDQLRNAGFIVGQQWELPRDSDVDEDLARLQRFSTGPFVVHSTGISRPMH